MGRPAANPAARLTMASARGRRFALVVSAFNRELSERLVEGALRTLARHGAADGDWSVHWVPGAFEIPVVASRLAGRPGGPDAILALGALIRGETSQYTVIADAVAQGLTAVSVQTGVPITFGIIVAETLAQAKQRAGGKAGNRGIEAAEAALALLAVLEPLPAAE